MQSTTPPRKWSSAEIADLKRFYLRKGAAWLTKKIKRTVCSIKNKAYRIGLYLEKRIITPQISQTIVQMRLAGKTFGQIALKLGIKYNTAYVHYKRKFKCFQHQATLFDLPL
jgi:DNA-binding NarL/FixJ family response regulator